jgi:hypothetical protein
MSAVWIAARCPACGWSNCLFVAEGGFITCSRIECPNPEAAHAALEGNVSGMLKTAARAGAKDRSGDRLTP